MSDPLEEKKIVVPEGMLKATVVSYNSKTNELGYRYVIDRYVMEAAIEAALRWLSDNPIVPTVEQGMSLMNYLSPAGTREWNQAMWIDFIGAGCAEWQRRMFLAPEPETPEEIKDLLLSISPTDSRDAYFRPDIYNERILEAYRRGQKGK